MMTEEDIDLWYTQEKENALKQYQDTANDPGAEAKYKKRMDTARQKYYHAVEKLLTNKGAKGFFAKIAEKLGRKHA